MSRFTQKYTIVCFLKPEDSLSMFLASDWPLHATIIDTFKTEWSVEDLLKATERVALRIAPFNVKSIKQAMLGPDKDVPVKLLQQDARILDLHSKLLALSEEGSFVFNTPEFVGEGFLPHVTDRPDGQIDLGQTYALTSISLVDMFPDEDPYRRRIIKTIQLSRI